MHLHNSAPEWRLWIKISARTPKYGASGGTRTHNIPLLRRSRIPIPAQTRKLFQQQDLSGYCPCRSDAIAFRPHRSGMKIWYVRWDSNPQKLVSETSPYTYSGTDAKYLVDRTGIEPVVPVGSSNLAPKWWTIRESNPLSLPRRP